MLNEEIKKDILQKKLIVLELHKAFLEKIKEIKSKKQINGK